MEEEAAAAARRRGRGLLRQVVEAHGDADVAGEADVDAEVDQSLLPRA